MTGVQTCALPICFPVTIQLRQEQLRQLENIFQQSESETAQIRQTAEKLVYSLQEKDKPFALEEMETQIEQLIKTQGLPAEQVGKLLELKKELAHIRDFRHQGELTIERHRKTRQDHLAIYTSACQSVADVRSALKQVEIEMNQAETELKNGQAEMLATQRNILEQRKQLGIHASDYVSHLQRYEQLLNQGGRLSASDVKELEVLEPEPTYRQY